MDMRKNVSPEFVLGSGALELVGRYALNLAAQKAFVVTDPGVVGAGWAEKVVTSLAQMDIPSVMYSNVTSNPRDTEVMEGARQFLDAGCDVIVAVGGGSPMDCAKGIGIVASSGRSILEFEGVDKVDIPGPPLICVPTTAGSSADVSQFAIINDSTRGVKFAIVSKAMVPDVALVDPVACTTLPPALTAATGMDALVHAMEAYVSTASSPVTDLHALEAVRLIGGSLREALASPEQLVFRDAMTMGSLLAGLAFSNASLGMVHAMAHALGGLLDLPHGECNALLLPHVVDFNFTSASRRYLEIAKALGIGIEGMPSDAQQERLVASLHALRCSVGLDRSLGELGVSRRDISRLAKFAHADPCLATNPVAASIQQIEGVYERAIEYR